MDPKFHLELDPEIVEQCDEVRSIASKKWTNASSVSLAKLDQIKAKVYTIGLNDAGSLRPPSCLSNHRDKENKPLFEEFKTEPQLLTLDYQKTAWGSNTSIPELLKQQSNRTRPVTSNTQSRTRPWSGKRPNTTSGISKPPIGPTKHDLTAPISVRGAKCDATTGKVLTPYTVDDWSQNNGSGFTTEHYQDSPRAPVPSPDSIQDKVDGRRSGRRSPMVLLRKPTPEPLHLQLPSMGSLSDEEDDDDDDDLDTERLLEKATVLSSKSNNDLDIDDRERKRSEVICKVTEAFGENSNVETENSHKSSSVLIREDKNNIIDISPRQPNTRSRPVSATKKRADQKCAQKVNSDKTFGPGGDNRNNRNLRTSQQSSSESEHVDPILVSIRIPAEQNGDSEQNGDIVQRGILSSNKLRIDSDSSNGSGIQKPVSPITVINIGSSEQTIIPETSRGFRSVSPKRFATGQRPVTPAATIVTVDYGDNTSRTCELSPLEDLNKHDNSAKTHLNTSGVQKSRPVSSRSNHYEKSLKSNLNEKVFKTTKTLEFDLTGAKDTSVKSVLDGECYKPTEPKSVSGEQLKKLKQIRPPTVTRKSCKIKSPPPMEDEDCTLNVVENLPHDVSYKGASFKINDPNFESKTYFDPSIGVKFLMFRQKSGNVRTVPINIKIKTEGLEAELVQPKISYARAKSAPVRPKWHSAKKGRSLFTSEEDKPKITKEKKPVNPEDILNIVSKNPDLEKFESQEKRECQYMKDKLARNGINVTTATLERALYPPTGKTLYYDVPGYLPATYSSSLLSHPRVWMPENYKRFKEAEKQLERANRMLWLQKREEERDDPGFKPIKPKPKSLLTTRKTSKSAKKRKKIKKPTLKRSQSFG